MCFLCRPSASSETLYRRATTVSCSPRSSSLSMLSRRWWVQMVQVRAKCELLGAVHPRHSGTLERPAGEVKEISADQTRWGTLESTAEKERWH